MFPLHIFSVGGGRYLLYTAIYAEVCYKAEKAFYTNELRKSAYLYRCQLLHKKCDIFAPIINPIGNNGVFHERYENTENKSACKVA